MKKYRSTENVVDVYVGIHGGLEPIPRGFWGMTVYSFFVFRSVDIDG